MLNLFITHHKQAWQQIIICRYWGLGNGLKRAPAVAYQYWELRTVPGTTPQDPAGARCQAAARAVWCHSVLAGSRKEMDSIGCVEFY